jgi:hypothetical protein
MSAQTNIDVQQGATFGAGAYLLSLVAAILSVELEIPTEMAFYQLVGDFEGYLSAQFYIHELGILTDGELWTGVLLWTVISIVILLSVGFSTASRASIGSGDGFKQGASVAIGYFALAILATVVLYVQLDNIDTGNMVIWLVVTGVVYPVVFGGIGGILAENAQ